MLQQDGGSSAAFSAYLIGAGVRLTLHQEMALTDPEQRSPDDWAKSSYGMPDSGTFAALANQAISYATPTWTDIKTKRRRSISVGTGDLNWQRRMCDDLSTTSDFHQYYCEMYVSAT
jgi:hypothetical protein